MQLSESRAGTEAGQKYIAADESLPSWKREAKESFVRSKLCQRIPYLRFEIPRFQNGKLLDPIAT